MKAFVFLLVVGIAAAQRAPERNCHEPAFAGVCLAYMPRFYYNTETKQCEKFIYGGCGDNGNNYKSKVECEQNCVQQSADVDLGVCALHPETGPCRAYVPSFYYDASTGTCKEFVYGGCDGNANRFATEESCYNKCPKGTNVDICSLDKETGPCRARHPMFYFNTKTGKCETFIYGGCRGNANRFETEESCEKRCGTQSDVDLCSMKPETGRCKAYIPSYYYDAETGTCKRFVYGGCGGNANRFRTEDKCHATCGKKEAAEEVDVCEMEAETGMCRGYFPSYYFDSKSGECKEFIYGGCGGNGNRFANKEDCYNKCSLIFNSPDDQCSLDAETGQCRGQFPRYYFNKNSGVCEVFIYGGCGGNSNNYETYEDCASACGSP